MKNTSNQRGMKNVCTTVAKATIWQQVGGKGVDKLQTDDKLMRGKVSRLREVMRLVCRRSRAGS